MQNIESLEDAKKFETVGVFSIKYYFNSSSRDKSKCNRWKSFKIGRKFCFYV